MKLDFNPKALLSNDKVRYALYALTALNMIGYASINRIDLVISFVCIAGVIYLFNKNIMTILILALLLTHLMSLHPGRFFEGMTTVAEKTKEVLDKSLDLGGPVSVQEKAEKDKEKVKEDSSVGENGEVKESDTLDLHKEIATPSLISEAYSNLSTTDFLLR